jgi:hypothetical protein
MIRKSRRTLVGVMLGVLVSIFIRDLPPGITFPRGPVTSVLLAVGFVIPDAVYDGIDWVFLVIKPVFIPVMVGAALCVIIAGADTIKRGMHLGFIVASFVVGLPLAALIVLAFVRGLSYPLVTWMVRIFIQPVACVASGMLAGIVIVLLSRLGGLARRRASTTL